MAIKIKKSSVSQRAVREREGQGPRLAAPGKRAAAARAGAPAWIIWVIVGVVLLLLVGVLVSVAGKKPTKRRKKRRKVTGSEQPSGPKKPTGMAELGGKTIGEHLKEHGETEEAKRRRARKGRYYGGASMTRDAD